MWKDSPNFEIACDIFYDTVTWNRKLAKERPCAFAEFVHKTVLSIRSIIKEATKQSKLTAT